MPLENADFPLNANDFDDADFDKSGDQMAVKFAAKFPQFVADPGTGALTIALPEPDGEDAGKFATSVGFDVDGNDPTTGILTVNMSDGTQVVGGMPGIITVAALTGMKRPMTSAFGRPLGYTAVE